LDIALRLTAFELLTKFGVKDFDQHVQRGNKEILALIDLSTWKTVPASLDWLLEVVSD
jgi:hypothetical protein